ncbi:MAG: hypothetical protein HN341_11275 [Verrucomicrobia bacterium]|nr:hypothetical protein [Verrucomicrobiota bacterium]
MKDWQKIRLARTDLTDYVIHFTKCRSGFDGRWLERGTEFRRAEEVFGEIIADGFIRPTFAPIKSMTVGTTANTVRGPDPAVCLTEQPLSAVIATRRCTGGRYSGFGIAYHKYALFQRGGRPVLYGSTSMLGRKLGPDEPGYQDSKDIYTEGLPTDLQYLCVQYKPTVGDWDRYPIDFTWEREWRYKCNGVGLPVYLEGYEGIYGEMPVGALVVERDEHIEQLGAALAAKAAQGIAWASKLTKIVSLETVERMLAAGDERYARIETYPE